MSMNNLEKKSTQIISNAFQYFINVALILLGIVLAILLGTELYHYFVQIFEGKSIGDNNHFLERILIFFLYIELITMIVKYFRENYHFPLRYFIYLGITALTRLIIISHTSGLQTLMYCLAILTLVISFTILDFIKSKKTKAL